MVNNSFFFVLSEPNNDVMLQGAGSGEIQLENPKEESLENDGGEVYSNKSIISMFSFQLLMIPFLLEANGLAGAVSSPLEENIGEESQIPAEEEKAAAAQRDSAPSPPQNVPRESTSTSSPDTDSPVLISVDVSMTTLVLCAHHIRDR